MMDDEQQQVRALRERLDRELAEVRASARSRERLRIGTAARAPAGRRLDHGVGRWRSPIAMPLAAAAVVVTVLAVPTYLRLHSSAGTPAPAGRPAISSSSPAPAPTTAPPSPAATAKSALDAKLAKEKASAQEKIRAAAAKKAKLEAVRGRFAVKVVPSVSKPGGLVRITLAGSVPATGDLTVTWGDGASTAPVTGSCSSNVALARKARQQALTRTSHTYRQAGQYSITVVISPCGSGQGGQGSATVIVR